MNKDLDMSDVEADAERMRDAQAAVDTEIAQEDALVVTSFAGRLEAWLGEQPDTADVELVMSDDKAAIFGFRLAGLGGMSLQVNVTP